MAMSDDSDAARSAPTMMDAGRRLTTAEIVRRMNNAIWPFITEETVRGVVYAYRNR